MGKILSKLSGILKKPVIHIILITLLGLLAYSNTFHAPFHFDDMNNIVENSELKDLGNFWPPSGSRWFGFVTFALNYHFGGLNTIGYHIVNLIIHIFNAILVYYLVILTFRMPYFLPPFTSPLTKGEHRGVINLIALFSALIFVSHPIQTQAVTYIVQRFTSLATFFYLLSLITYITSRLSMLHAVRYTLYAVSFFSAILAMKTKEISFTLPVVIALYEFMFFEGKVKKRILYLIPFLLTMLIIPLSLISVDKPIGDAIGELREATQETEEVPRWSYLFTQFRVIVTYIRLLFLPINQNLDYNYPIYDSFFDLNVFLSFLFLLSVFGLVVYLFYRSRSVPSNSELRTSNSLNTSGYPLPPTHYTQHATRLISFGIFWFFITLSVESSIIPIRDVIFEHRLYLPSVGIIIAFSTGGFYVLQFLIRRIQNTEHRPKFFLAACSLLLAAAVVVLSIATYQRNTVWQDEVSLWEDVVRKSPYKARGHNNLGCLGYYKRGWIEKAIQAYQTSLKLKLDYAPAYYNLGIAYKDKGWIDEAIEHYQSALRFNPNYFEAYNNLGHAYSNKGWIDRAIEYYQMALRLNPDYAIAYYNLGHAYSDKDLLDKAIEYYQMAIKLNPNYSEAHNNLGGVYIKKGLLDEAIKEFLTALSLDPKNQAARDNLNEILRIKK